jgi:lysophospholipase L1-like esterase
MSKAGGTASVGRFVKLGLLGASGAAVVVLGYAWVEQAQHVVRLKMMLGLLNGLEVVYVVTLAACLVGVPALTALVVVSRRRGVERHWAARGLLLVVSMLFAMAVGEAATAVVQARWGRASVMPAGPFGPELRNQSWLLPDTTEMVALPTEFPEMKNPDELDIVVLGESSAEGVPYSLFSISPLAIVKWRLEQENPAKVIRLTTLAFWGQTLEKQHRLLAKLKRKPDVLIVYCGHNEFTARLPASRDQDYYLDTNVPRPWERFVERIEHASPILGTIRRAAESHRVAIPPSPNGNRQLVDTPVYTQAEYDVILGDFRRRLTAIIDYAEQIGAVPVLISPSANDAGFEPSRSFLPPETKRAEREAFAVEVQAARRRESTDPEGAIKAYLALVERFPGFAETHFRLARLLDASGNWNEAYDHYVKARDRDGLPMRCPDDFQDVYRTLAESHRNCVFIDTQACFHVVGRHGLLDDRLFFDAMHPTLRGQVALAQAILAGLRGPRLGLATEGPALVVDPMALMRQFPLDKHAWKKICHWGIMFLELTAAARFDPSERHARQDAFGKASDKLDAGTPPEEAGLFSIGVPEGVPPTSVGVRRSVSVEPGLRQK